MSSFGAQLRQERERQGISLEDISLTTKIGTRMLRALEEEHFDQLPGGIFNKGFIRAYARCLHMDEDQAVADYLVATGAGPLARKSENDDQAPILDPPSREENPSRRRRSLGHVRRRAVGRRAGLCRLGLLLPRIGKSDSRFRPRGQLDSSQSAHRFTVRERRTIFRRTEAN